MRPAIAGMCAITLHLCHACHTYAQEDEAPRKLGTTDSTVPRPPRQQAGGASSAAPSAGERAEPAAAQSGREQQASYCVCVCVALPAGAWVWGGGSAAAGLARAFLTLFGSAP